mmetsp:Transcript_16043/g.23486  ORF Transcript_16043/g.23486 Transcript_16043/m.23486 type:complete len:136 (+) Transcript_16043:133-540(+)
MIQQKPCFIFDIALQNHIVRHYEYWTLHISKLPKKQKRCHGLTQSMMVRRHKYHNIYDDPICEKKCTIVSPDYSSSSLIEDIVNKLPCLEEPKDETDDIDSTDLPLVTSRLGIFTSGALAPTPSIIPTFCAASLP